jgi:hypothetical protein
VTEDEAKGCQTGDTVEYLGATGVIVGIHTQDAGKHHGFQTFFQIRTASGGTYVEVDYPQVRLRPVSEQP